MYVFGHVGLTVAAARAADRDADLRWPALLAVIPDLVDKPVARLFPALVHHNSRGFGHTLLFSLLVLAGAALWTRRPKTALLLWGCYAGHFLLDAMWMNDNPVILFWPALGAIPRPVYGHVFSWLSVWYVLGEIAGVTILFGLARRHGLFERPGLAAFLKSGRLGLPGRKVVSARY